MIKRALFCGVMLLSVSAIAETPVADASALQMEIEVEERAGKQSVEHSTFQVPLVGDHAVARINEAHQGVKYAIEIMREGGDAQAPIVNVAVERKQTMQRDYAEQIVKATVRVKRGTRTIVSQLERDDGTKIAIWVTVR